MVSFQSALKIIKSKSPRYILFRSKYELERKTGLLAHKYPTTLKAVPVPSLDEWREKGCGWFFEDKETLKVAKNKAPELKKKMEHILKGDALFFSKTWKPLGHDYDWVTNPETGYRYDARQHWTKINDFSKEAGDIKFVWEKSRFSWLLTVCRYDYHYDEDHSEYVYRQILDWIDKNPLNCGPNYKCSQETSIRILNWIFALNFYRKSEALTEDRWKTIITSIYWQTDHVMKNINFSRIAVRNNHAITETLTLYLMGLMFPMMKGASSWKRKGKKWFEEEIYYQIEDDGTFIQDSMNYHRVVVQLLTYAIALTDRHGERFSDFVYEKAYKSVYFLYQCQEPTNGWLPNYGANDGALFFPLSDADYRDYRPQLDALHGLLTGKSLYGFKFKDSDLITEDAEWVGGEMPASRKAFPKIEKQFELVKFEKSGYYLIREQDTLTFLRCGLFKTNGSTDQLHMDVWYKGQNVLMDGGSYMYNTDEETVRYFAGTESHNTIMLGDYDQMQKGMRFIWFYPPTLLSAKMREEDESYVFEGKVNAFKQIGEDISIRRVVEKKKNVAEWVITDIVENASAEMMKRQLWHTSNNENYNENAKIHFESNGERKEKDGWTSDYYGVKRPTRQIEFQTSDNKISTKIIIKE